MSGKLDKDAIITERIKGIEERVERLKAELGDTDSIAEGLDMRINNIEKARPCKTVQAIQKQIIDFFPEQQRLLEELKSGQDKIFQLIGQLQNKIDIHNTRIESLESIATIESHHITEIRSKNAQWAAQFIVSFILVILVGIAVFVRPDLNNLIIFKLVGYGATGVLFGKIALEMWKTFKGL